MRDAFSVVSALHHAINSLEISVRYDFHQLQRALASDELAPHPDDLPELQLIMKLDAAVLRRLAADIEAGCDALERDNIVYLHAGSE